MTEYIAIGTALLFSAISVWAGLKASKAAKLAKEDMVACSIFKKEAEAAKDASLESALNAAVQSYESHESYLKAEQQHIAASESKDATLRAEIAVKAAIALRIESIERMSRANERLGILMQSDLWRIAEEAVSKVRGNMGLQAAAQIEPNIAFCPNCGQVPTGDRRMDEARALAIKILGSQPRRHELDFAVAWHYWSIK